MIPSYALGAGMSLLKIHATYGILSEKHVGGLLLEDDTSNVSVIQDTFECKEASFLSPPDGVPTREGSVSSHEHSCIRPELALVAIRSDHLPKLLACSVP